MDITLKPEELKPEKLNPEGRKYPTEQEKIDALTAKLEEGLKSLYDSDTYKNWLKCVSTFHRYSLSNTILIAMQGRDIEGFKGQIASFTKWNSLGRKIIRGQKGIRIFAPAPYKKQVERDAYDPVTNKPLIEADGSHKKEQVEITVPAFKQVVVFDAAQTEGEPLPELGVDELKFSVENYADFMKALTAISPVPVEFAQIETGAKGYFSPNEQKIVINEGMSEAQTVKTLIHEISHSMAHDKDHDRVDGLDKTVEQTKNAKEVTAESIATIVAGRFGIDTSDYSLGYIAGYDSGQDMKELKSSLENIKLVASQIITGVEEKMAEIQQEREAVAEVAQVADKASLEKSAIQSQPTENIVLKHVEEQVEENMDQIDTQISNTAPEKVSDRNEKSELLVKQENEQHHSEKETAKDSKAAVPKKKESIKKKLEEKKELSANQKKQPAKAKTKSQGKEL